MIDGIKLYYEGRVPEKEFETYKAGKVCQNPACKPFAEDMRMSFEAQGCKGYLDNDPKSSYQSYTPIRVKSYIYDDAPKALIKQTKAIQDSLNKVAYADDCSIAELYIEYRASDQAKLYVQIGPADRDAILMPITEPVIVNRYISPLTSVPRKKPGEETETTTEDPQKDQDKCTFIREAFEDQYDNFEKLADAETVEIYAIIGVERIRERLTPATKKMQSNMHIFPVAVPDIDNQLYTILKALAPYLEGKRIVKIHACHVYYNAEGPVNQIWVVPI